MSDKIYTPGMAIENKPQEIGALGCFARRRDDPSVSVLLGNAHVLFGSATGQQNVRIYQPPSGSTCCRKTHIATTLETWDAGFGSVVVVRVPEGPVAGGDAADFPGGELRGYETDCAIARIVDGIRFTNEIPIIGMIQGTPPAGDLGVVGVQPSTEAPAPEQLVRFYSPRTERVHYGTIVPSPKAGTYVSGGSGAVNPLLWPWPAGDDSDASSDARPNINQLVVMPRPAPGESYEPYLQRHASLFFGRHDDSGSIVVNHENKVIGLLVRGGGPVPPYPGAEGRSDPWRAIRSIGIVTPIHAVLARLGIEIPAAFSRTSPSSGVAYSIAPGVETDPDEIAVEAGRQRIEKVLARTRLGRLLRGKLEQHRKEARRLVLGNRRAMIAWHRHQGPAFIKHFVENLRDSSHVVPTVINGVERAKVLDVMADMFIRYGSPKLRRDVEKYRPLALRFGPHITQLDQLGPLLEQVRAEQVERYRRPSP